MNAKETAGIRAAEYIDDGMVVGLGTGSTADFAIRALGKRVENGLTVKTIPTSIASEKLARSLDIPLTNFKDHPVIDLTIDGADEVDPQLNLIKGLGGALLREKIVASSTIRQIIIIDTSKQVKKLGIRSPLPIEVIPFSWPLAFKELTEHDLQPKLRQTKTGQMFKTDNGNLIIDCNFPDGINNPSETNDWINKLPGVIENGLFVELTDLVIIGQDNGDCQFQERPQGKCRGNET
ncbi:MAG: ribose 5-phosphate isomerase A [Candidatus Latescibacterota bacterium]|nr:ribose 5-phosphate isomerase A [Candidatus Latescibacterota bacterium]